MKFFKKQNIQELFKLFKHNCSIEILQELCKNSFKILKKYLKFANKFSKSNCVRIEIIKIEFPEK